MRIVHYGQSCVLIETGSARLLFDPGVLSSGFEDLRDLTAVLVTHQHFDHLDTAKLPALMAANPQATLVVDPGTAQDEIAKLDLPHTTVHPGDALSLAGTAVNVTGGDHAVIHKDRPVPPNVCYVVEHGAFYHPGDSFFVPEQKIDVLGIPIGAPWLKAGEAIEFLRAVSPRLAVPIHQAMLSDVGRAGLANWLTELGPDGTELHVLTPLEPADL